MRPEDMDFVVKVGETDAGLIEFACINNGDFILRYLDPVTQRFTENFTFLTQREYQLLVAKAPER